jgi:tetratricopeptide (TPR) repeat protein
MKVHHQRPAIVIAGLLLASAAWAAIGDPPKSSVPSGGDASVPSASGSGPRNSRQEAELSYALAYEELAKAEKEAAEGKKKNADKKLKRVLERGERAVALDPGYHEAWNLVGYAARKLGNYDKAFAAYDRCLTIKLDYAPARVYLGEAWLERGDAKKAREQLVLLEKFQASSEAGALRQQIEAWEAAHPSAAAPAEATPADTAATPAGGLQP